MSKLPNYFEFNDIIHELENASMEALKAQKLYGAAAEIGSALASVEVFKKGMEKIKPTDYQELDRLTFEMIFITFNTRIEQVMGRLNDELDVYENWVNEGKNEAAANMARRAIAARPSNLPKPAVLECVKKKFTKLFNKTTNNASWAYVLDCYKRRDKLMHGKEKVGDAKKDLRLRTGAVSKLCGHVDGIARAIKKQTC